jgi:hypothetical protein
MANVKITCITNDAAEAISKYHFYEGDVELGFSTTPDFTALGVTPGIHKYQVAAENAWEIGPKSDPVFTPPIPSKCQGMTINIIFNIGV